MKRPIDPSTLLASTGVAADPAHRGIAPPLWASDTFEWDSPDEKPEFDYSRTVHPNRNLLAQALGGLEGAAGAIITNSGQSAALLALLTLKPGSTVIAPHDCYGGTFRLLRGLEAKGFLRARFVDQGSEQAFASALNDGPALVWLESPSNPLLRLVPIAARAAAAKAAGALTLADNTLPTPCRQRPLDLGCHLVLHSTTKAINGHNDLFGGALLARDAALLEELEWWSNAAGLNGPAFDSWQILRGLRTLPLRVARQEQTAIAVAQWLNAHPDIEQVHYPGLADHPQHALSLDQQSGPGFVLSFRVTGDATAVQRFLAALELITLAASIGGFASLICTPATMTHRGMPPEAQREAGVTPDLLRLSVGLEHPDDLIEDLARAFSAI